MRQYPDDGNSASHHACYAQSREEGVSNFRAPDALFFMRRCGSPVRHLSRRQRRCRHYHVSCQVAATAAIPAATAAVPAAASIRTTTIVACRFSISLYLCRHASPSPSTCLFIHTDTPISAYRPHNPPRTLRKNVLLDCGKRSLLERS